MNDAELDDVGEFFYIEEIEVFGGFVFVLLFDVLLDVALDVGEEVLVDFVVSEIEDVFDGFFHFGDVEGI